MEYLNYVPKPYIRDLDLLKLLFCDYLGIEVLPYAYVR